MGRKKKGNVVNGWLNIDKPYGMTSTQAIGRVRRVLSPQKIGHAGTLDPLATGVLPIAMGEATKTIPFIQDAIKTYTFTVVWGERRSTDDAEGDITAISDKRPSQKDILDALPAFIGEIDQTPPLFSAIKIDGQRAYDLARQGERPEIKSRKTYIKSFELIEARQDDADFRVICGKGTYVRALARDIAVKMGTLGYVSKLTREKVGIFTTESAISLDKLAQMEYVAALNEALQPLQIVLDDIPALSLKQEEAAMLKSGQILRLISKPDFDRLEQIGLGTTDKLQALAVFQGAPVALVEAKGAEVKPVRVFNL